MKNRKPHHGCRFRRGVLWGMSLVLTLSCVLLPLAPSAGAAEAETLPEEQTVQEWKGFDVGAHLDEISFKIAIQIGDTGFNQLGFSEVQSKRYIKTLSAFADRMAEKGVRVISAPAPTAINTDTA